jgi:hypothetical protein
MDTMLPFRVADLLVRDARFAANRWNTRRKADLTARMTGTPAGTGIYQWEPERLIGEWRLRRVRDRSVRETVSLRATRYTQR